MYVVACTCYFHVTDDWNLLAQLALACIMPSGRFNRAPDGASFRQRTPAPTQAPEINLMVCSCHEDTTLQYRTYGEGGSGLVSAGNEHVHVR